MISTVPASGLETERKWKISFVRIFSFEWITNGCVPVCRFIHTIYVSQNHLGRSRCYTNVSTAVDFNIWTTHMTIDFLCAALVELDVSKRRMERCGQSYTHSGWGEMFRTGTIFYLKLYPFHRRRWHRFVDSTVTINIHLCTRVVLHSNGERK